MSLPAALGARAEKGETRAPLPSATCVVGSGPCLVALAKIGTGSGTVTSDPAGFSCGADCLTTFELGATIWLTAVPDAGSVFTGWAGCEPVASPICAFTALPELSIYAIFDRVGDPATPLPVVQPGGSPPPGPPQYLPPGCTIGGTDENDVIEGTARADVICALGGRDHVHGGGGADVIRAGAGDDVIEAEGGNDRIDPGPGRDIVSAGSGEDSISSRDRTRDVIRGGPGRDIVRGDPRDVLIGIERRQG